MSSTPEYKVDPLEHKGFAYQYANKYISQGERQGYSLKDLEQVAMLAICLAAQGYDKSKGSFTTYSKLFLRRELNKVIYANSGSSENRYIRVKELPFGDVTEAIGFLGEEYNPFLDLLCTDPEEDEGNLWVQEFVQKIKLEKRDKQYFQEIVSLGASAATGRFIRRTGMTTQGAHLVRQKMMKDVKRQYKEAIEPVWYHKGFTC